MIEYRVDDNARILFVGKVTDKKFRGTRDCTYDRQGNTGRTRIYVMHFPIRSPVEIRLAELKKLKTASQEG